MGFGSRIRDSEFLIWFSEERVGHTKSAVTGLFDDTPLERSVKGYDPEFNVSQGRKKRLTQLGELRSARGLAGEE